MEGDGVEVEVKAQAAFQSEATDGVEPLGHEGGVGARIDAAAVLGEERALRWAVESGEQGEAVIEHLAHDVAVAGGAEELQCEQGAHGAGRRHLARAGEVRLLQQRGQRDAGQPGQE